MTVRAPCTLSRRSLGRLTCNVKTSLRRLRMMSRVSSLTSGRCENSCKTLTPREDGVFALVVTRILNKQTARELGIVEKTVKVHRARGMEAMRAGSLAQLVQLGRRSGRHRRQVMSVPALAPDVPT